MGFSLRFILSSAAVALGLANGACAQESDTAYVVTYIEVGPSAGDRAVELLTAYADASREDDGNAVFHVLQRIGRPAHFAILEAWSSPQDQAAHASQSHTTRFRDSLAPLLYSPYDERPHVSVQTARSSGGGANAIFALTHVDVIPTGLELGVSHLEAVVGPSRRDAGNLRFDVLGQSSRMNHMTLVEIWEDATAQEQHAGTDHSQTLRQQLLPLSGSLYDERLYRAL